LFNKGLDDNQEVLGLVKTFCLDYFEVFASNAAEVFSVAALFGSSFYLSGLTEVLGRDVSPDLERLLADGVVLESNTSRIPAEREFRIPVPILREAAISVFEPPARSALHVAIASWVSNRNPARAREHTRFAQNAQSVLLVQSARGRTEIVAKNKKTPLVKGSRAQKPAK
jgi:hypothetical protein